MIPFCRDLIVRRTLPGAYIRGVFSPGAVQVFGAIQASIHPLSPEELLILEEGSRSKSWIKVFSNFEMFSQRENQAADVLDIGGSLYQVMQVTDMKTFYRGSLSLVHYKIQAVQVGEK